MSEHFNPEQLNNEEGGEIGEFGIDKAIEDKIVNAMAGGYDDMAERIIKENNVSEEVKREIAEKDILSNFGKRNHKDTLRKISFYGINEAILNDNSFVELGKERVNLKLSQGDIRGAYEALSDLKIDEKYLDGEEAIKSVEAGIQNVLSVDDVSKALEIKKAFNISPEVMEGIVKAEIKVRLLNDLVNGAVSLQEKFNISSGAMNEIIKDEILSRLSFGSSLNNIANFVNRLEMDVSFLNDSKIKEALKARIGVLMEEKTREEVPVIFKSFIDEKEVGEIGEKA